MDSPKISSSRIILSILLLVLFGGTIGSLGTAWYMERQVRVLIDLGPVGMRKIIMTKLRKELELSGEQAEKLEKCVEVAQNSYAELRNLHKSEINEITQKMSLESAKFLTEEQIVKFDLIRNKFLKRNDPTAPKEN